jgi:hypothetical protein
VSLGLQEKGVEDNIGNCVTDEEEDGAVTVLKLSNGVMFRVPVEVQGMQLQAVVDSPSGLLESGGSCSTPLLFSSPSDSSLENSYS